jgi:VWFA-related protein
MVVNRGSPAKFRGTCSLNLIILWLILCIVQGNIFAQDGAAPGPIRVRTVLVNVPVVITDERGGYLTGLKKEDFTLYEDGKMQPVALFAASEEPVQVALLLDTSKSTVTVLKKIKKAAMEFVKRMRPKDRALIMTFDSQVNLHSRLRDDKKELEEILTEIKTGAYVGTRLKDAVFEITSNYFKSIPGRKAIVLFSDGQDFGSRVSDKELLASVNESGTLIYSIFYLVDVRALAKELFDVPFPQRTDTASGSPWAQREREARAFLQEISVLSAGRFSIGQASNLNQTFIQIIDELRHQYLLAFYPEKAKLDGAEHALKVEVNRTGTIPRCRPSYRVLIQEN